MSSSNNPLQLQYVIGKFPNKIIRENFQRISEFFALKEKCSSESDFRKLQVLSVYFGTIDMPNIIKTTPEDWIKAAKKALIAEGLTGVKVDRLAKSLGVTRGGFYHNFKSQQELMDRLLDHWATSNEFVPDMSNFSAPADAITAFEHMTEMMIAEKGFSPALDMAIREWARIDKKVMRIVDRVDYNRIKRLTTLFTMLGCDAEEAPIRARVLYFHQIGYYALGYHKRQTKAERFRNAPVYMRILGGRHYIDQESRRAKRRKQ